MDIENIDDEWLLVIQNIWTAETGGMSSTAR
jgi:hypothetical protein